MTIQSSSPVDGGSSRSGFARSSVAGVPAPVNENVSKNRRLRRVGVPNHVSRLRGDANADGPGRRLSNQCVRRRKTEVILLSSQIERYRECQSHCHPRQKRQFHVRSGGWGLSV